MNSPSWYVNHNIASLDTALQVIAQARLEGWAWLTGCTPYTGSAPICLERLSNARHRCGTECPYWMRILDHGERWRGPAGEVVYTAHPYGPLGAHELGDLVELAEIYGAELTIDSDWSWYKPGATVLVVLWGRRRGTLKATEARAQIRAALASWPQVAPDVAAWLKALHWRIRQVVILVHVERCTHDQVAARLRMGRAAVGTDLARAYDSWRDRQGGQDGAQGE